MNHGENLNNYPKYKHVEKADTHESRPRIGRCPYESRQMHISEFTT